MHPGTLTKRVGEKLDGNYARMLCAVLDKSLKPIPPKQQMYGHLLPLLQIVLVRRTKYTVHYRKNKELFLRKIFSYGIQNMEWLELADQQGLTYICSV